MDNACSSFFSTLLGPVPFHTSEQQVNVPKPIFWDRKGTSTSELLQLEAPSFLAGNEVSFQLPLRQSAITKLWAPWASPGANRPCDSRGP
jgi:hypothetical protein